MELWQICFRIQCKIQLALLSSSAQFGRTVIDIWCNGNRYWNNQQCYAIFISSTRSIMCRWYPLMVSYFFTKEVDNRLLCYVNHVYVLSVLCPWRWYVCFCAPGPLTSPVWLYVDNSSLVASVNYDSEQQIPGWLHELRPFPTLFSPL